MYGLGGLFVMTSHLSRLPIQKIIASLTLMVCGLSITHASTGDKDQLLVIRPGSPQFTVVYDAMLDELEGEWPELQIQKLIINDRTSLKKLTRVYDRIEPDAILLMDVSSILLYKELQNERPDATFPPAVIVMASFVNEQVQKLRNATGIVYEVQAITAMTYIRNLYNGQVTRIGVLYSNNLRDFWQRQVREAHQEKIQLIGINVNEDERRVDRQILRGLRKLREEHRVDAIWILNDNPLLRKAEYHEWGWRPGLRKFKGPVVVSVESLIGRGQVGQFAIVPNHRGLGTQVALYLISLHENDWKIEEGAPNKVPSYDRKYNADKITPDMLLNKETLSNEWEPAGADEP